jgi:poly-beta-1,6-N-acetyl-D-glucosamine synthase
VIRDFSSPQMHPLAQSGTCVKPPIKSAYVVVTPTRNEERYLSRTIASMIGQTVKPVRWVVVNDGSNDRTGALIDEAAAQHTWIRAVHRQDRGSRQAGSGVIEAFYDGYGLVDGETWDCVVKLDGDLSFDPDYFEKCLREFELDPTLGIAGGTCCKESDGHRVPEFTGEPPFHVRGPSKIYRRECFEAIGGLIKAPGWDTVDLIEANRLGWKTKTFPHILLSHLRATGGAYGSWSNVVKNGLANYVTGYHPLFMFFKCLKRFFMRPYVVEGVGLMAGFLKGYWKRIPQTGDRQTIAYLRSQQMNFLLGRDSLWRRPPVNLQRPSSP